jgi:hypothetical protein
MEGLSMIEKHISREVWDLSIARVEARREEPAFRKAMDAEVARIVGEGFTTEFVEGVLFGVLLLAEREICAGVSAARAIQECAPGVIYVLHKMGFKLEDDVVSESSVRQPPKAEPGPTQAEIDAVVEKMLRNGLFGK